MANNDTAPPAPALAPVDQESLAERIDNLVLANARSIHQLWQEHKQTPGAVLLEQCDTDPSSGAFHMRFVTTGTLSEMFKAGRVVTAVQQSTQSGEVPVVICVHTSGDGEGIAVPVGLAVAESHE